MLAEIKLAVLGEGDPGMALIRLDGATAIATVLDEARTPSMFAPRKLVIVDPADPLLKAGGDEAPPTKGRRASGFSNREIMENYIEAPSESAVCWCWCAIPALKTTRLHKILDKQGAIRWCEPIKAQQVPAWLTKRARDILRQGHRADGRRPAGRLDWPRSGPGWIMNWPSFLCTIPKSPTIPVKAVDQSGRFPARTGNLGADQRPKRPRRPHRFKKN